MALKKWNTNFRLEHSVRKKQDYLFRCPVAPGNFLVEFSGVPLTFQPDFRETFFVNGKQQTTSAIFHTLFAQEPFLGV